MERKINRELGWEMLVRDRWDRERFGLGGKRKNGE